MSATKDQIADVFERHVARFGYGKATVEDVAAELGISKKTIYEHFSSKRDLYLYIVERVADTWSAEMRAAVKDLPLWADKMEGLMTIVLTGARQHIEQTTKTDWQQEYEVVGEALMKAVGAVMHEIVSGGIAAGEFTMTDAALTERLLGAIALEYTMVVRDDPSVAADAEVVAAMRRFLGAV